MPRSLNKRFQYAKRNARVEIKITTKSFQCHHSSATINYFSNELYGAHQQRARISICCTSQYPQVDIERSRMRIRIKSFAQIACRIVCLANAFAAVDSVSDSHFSNDRKSVTTKFTRSPNLRFNTFPPDIISRVFDDRLCNDYLSPLLIFISFLRTVHVVDVTSLPRLAGSHFYY